MNRVDKEGKMNNKLEKVTAVLVGCGSISKGWHAAAGDISNLEIVGLVDIKKENALARESEYGLWRRRGC